MRLRYIRVADLPPLEDVAITFGHEPALGRHCAINFVVGVNGSGKSRLLQTIIDVLLHLESRRLPPYPVTLAYDLGTDSNARTIYLYHPGGDASKAMLVHFERLPQNVLWTDIEDAEWDDLSSPAYKIVGKFRGNELPGEGSIGAYLPSVLLAYTSGATDSWEDLFAARRSEQQGALGIISSLLTEETSAIQERPPDWDQLKEIEVIGRESFNRPPDDSPADPTLSTTQSIGLFVPPKSIRIALAAVTLDQAAREMREDMATEQAEEAFKRRINRSIEEGRRMPGLRGVLNEVDWLWPVTLCMRLSFKSEQLTSRRREELKRLYGVATSIVREPEPGSGRRLFFDLRRRVDNDQQTTADALMETLGGSKKTPLAVFIHLSQWQREGLLQDVFITLRKRNLDDLLHYDWLSDGERVFLGRMALLHLLRGEDANSQPDALIVLDEPETHFNDVWKREIVDIIDDSLGNVASNVVITTHSSIALTDVFDNEITLLIKSASDGQVKASRAPVPSFGASPAEIMRDIFGAPESVGQRASKFLDMVLTAAAAPAEIEAIWKLDGDKEAIKNSEQFQRLRQSVRRAGRRMERDYGNDDQLDQRLLNMLDLLSRYARENTLQGEPSLAVALDSLENRLGAGYYQFEFRRRLRTMLGEGTSDAS